MLAKEIHKFTIRGNYPGYRVTNYIIDSDSESRPEIDLQGYIPPELEYEIKGDETNYRISLELADIKYLSDKNPDIVNQYIFLIHEANNNIESAITLLASKRVDYINEARIYFKKCKFVENQYVVPSSTENHYGIRQISHKGESLLELSQKGYPVPDFSILTSSVFLLTPDERKNHVHDCIRNLEMMTGNKLGSNKKPLVFAMRCAMSKYIPGLMPTFLNVGVTQDTFVALKDQYGFHVASKIYLNNLHNIYELLFPDKDPPVFDDDLSRHSFRDIYKIIQYFYDEIHKVDRKLLVDPEYQVLFFIEEVYKFYRNNKELLQSLIIKDKSYPSLILQRMVWTVRDKESYPGVLYSRHSRTGLGTQIESYPEIFGEEIMTGAIETIDTEFFDVEEIKCEFPAIYHFYDEIPKLEKSLRSPVTIEFAAESFRGIHFFALLQLNNSEMTGRATLLSAIDMYKNGVIGKDRVINLVHPYHLKQIFSDSINDKSISKLDFFSSGVSVLPRLAASCKVYFSAEKAMEAKKTGEMVCLCKEQFIPSDTIVMGEVDAIISLNPAAIHVVTACLSYGVPAFLNLEKFHVKMVGDSLVNVKGLTIKEGDWITISSKNKKIFLGKASYVPARLQRYLDGAKLDLQPKEETVFKNLALGYASYKEIVDDLDFNEFDNLSDLSKYIRTDLKNEPVKASKIMNSWFDSRYEYYTSRILNSRLGMHKEQHDLYSLLSQDRQITFFKNIIKQCVKENLSGIKAGSFMIGKFLSISHSINFWKSFDTKQIKFMLNEFIAYSKYLHVLNEIGERNLSKVKDRILSDGLKDIDISFNNIGVFVTLKLSSPDWSDIKNEKVHDLDKQSNVFVEYLEQPFGKLFDYNVRWSINKLKKICLQENVGFPEEEGS